MFSFTAVLLEECSTEITMAIPEEIISLANDIEDGSSLEAKDSELSEQEQERRRRNCQASKRLRKKLSQRHEELKKVACTEEKR